MKTKPDDTKPVVSLTTFVDYIAKAGKPKLTIVRNAVRNYGEYDPKTDFWKALREGIVEFHRNGSSDKADLDLIAGIQNHEPKKKAYPIAVEAYKKFLGRKEIDWFEPERTTWETTDLVINVNPELGLKLNGSPVVIKLYFRKDPIGKPKADLIRLLMLEAMKESHPGTPVALLDVQKGKLYAKAKVSLELVPLLEAEARSFASMWASLSETLPSEPDSKDEKSSEEGEAA